MTSTPRQPLLDIRQVPPSNQQDEGPRKTPLVTPRQVNKHRKKRLSTPASEKENVTRDNVQVKSMRKTKSFGDEGLPKVLEEAEPRKSKTPDGRKSKSPELVIDEDLLLGNYSGNEESLCDSTKSEDELLSTPHESNVPLNFQECKSACETENEVFGSKTLKGEAVKKTGSPNESNPYTYKPNFLANIARMERVQNAASFLAKLTFSDTKRNLYWVPTDGPPRLKHSEVQSPLRQGVKNITGAIKSLAAFSPINLNRRSSDDNDEDDDIDEVEEKKNESRDSLKEVSEDGTVQSEGGDSGKGAKRTLKNLLDGMKENKSLLDDIEQGINSISFANMNSNNNCSTPIVEKTNQACSPIFPEVCDISIQNEVERQSINCSPMKFENLDVSIQNCADVHSMMCSPMNFPLNDISIQNCAEMESVSCSPIQIPQNDVSIQNVPERHSVMCSPLHIPTTDISIQNVAEFQSVLCSPMVQRPDQDKSVLACGPECVDMGVGTDPALGIEVGVSVRPDVVSTATDMDDSPMMHSGTSMTPLKIDKKTKKLTAEDVRRQHPRVLANEFETLRLQNTRLESQIAGLEKDRKKLVAQEELEHRLESVSKELSALKEEYAGAQEGWQAREETLVAETQEVRLQYDTQLKELRAEYETTNYRDHFLASQSLVQKLQTELDQYTQLMGDVDTAHKLQEELEQVLTESFNKVQEKAAWVTEQAAKNVEKEKELTMENDRVKEESDNLISERSKLETEKEEMNKIVATCRDNLLQMDGQLERTSTELFEAKQAVEKLTLERDSLLTDKAEGIKRCKILQTERDSLSEECDKLKDDISKLEESNTKLHEEIERLNQSAREEQSSHEAEVSKMKLSLDKKILQVTNLQRTLDNREDEIDRQENDLFECRELLSNQLEDLKEAEKSKRELTMKVATLTTECDKYKDLLVDLRSKQQEAIADLRAKEKAYDDFKASTLPVLKLQESQIAECSSAIDQLYAEMRKVLAGLRKKAGIAVENNREATGQTKEPSSDTAQSKPAGARSLVSQILTAACPIEQNIDVADSSENQQLRSKNVEPLKQPDIDVKSSLKVDGISSGGSDTPSTVSRKKLGFSGNSAFAPVRKTLVPVENADTLDSAKDDEIVDDANEKEVKDEVDQDKKGIKECAGEKKDSNNLSKEKLANQLEEISDVFTEIMRVAQLIEKALRSSLNDVTFENSDLRSQVTESEHGERRACAELDLVNKELEQKRGECERLTQQQEEMGERFGDLLDQKTELERLQEELDRTQKKLTSVESERALLNGQVEELLAKMEANSSSSGVDVALQRETLALQKKVDKYRTLLTEAEAKLHDISVRSTKRIMTLDANGKRADAEVHRLDQLVDSIRNELTRHRLARQDEHLRRMIAMIEGRASLSSSERKGKEDDKELKPVKTSMW
ncbi:early endosome antigen 1-like [Mya arenaria]|uniref:early endosome antigen 1-like n=1 Tax=Mya arenaria TaxID=6604 RepID=UPI0022E8D388|nr:early endosome antigen 1-like [Mya arenaria]